MEGQRVKEFISRVRQQLQEKQFVGENAMLNGKIIIPAKRYITLQSYDSGGASAFKGEGIIGRFIGGKEYDTLCDVSYERLLAENGWNEYDISDCVLQMVGKIRRGGILTINVHSIITGEKLAGVTGDGTYDIPVKKIYQLQRRGNFIIKSVAADEVEWFDIEKTSLIVTK